MGGRLTERLDQLVQTGFIEAYIPWDKKRGEYYKVIDEFCLFYLYWLMGHKGKKFVSDYWLKQAQKPIYHVWAGYAFEAVCHKHVNAIIDALKIKTAEIISSWRFVPRKNKVAGAQIDLLIDRSDDTITLAEIKYTDKPFVISKEYAENLQNKMTVFERETNTKKQIFMVLISANGIKQNQWSQQLISSVVTLEDLFK